MFLRLEEPAQRWHHEAGGWGEGVGWGPRPGLLPGFSFPVAVSVSIIANTV